ncbi:Kelch-like protein 12, variant 2 [Clonorchis sinensis]|nr:Kelch-like protein 12, variant 2 [Clonorchis sinensis]
MEESSPSSPVKEGTTPKPQKAAASKENAIPVTTKVVNSEEPKKTASREMPENSGPSQMKASNPDLQPTTVPNPLPDKASPSPRRLISVDNLEKKLKPKLIIRKEFTRQLPTKLSTITIRFPEAAENASVDERATSDVDRSGPQPASYLYQKVDHSKSLLSRLNEQRQQNQLCDVIFQVGPKQINAHRAVLAAGSDYFCNLFEENTNDTRSGTLTVPEFDEGVFTSLINFLYTGEICLTTSTVQSLLATAMIFQIEEVQKACWEFMQLRLCTANCLSILRFADLLENTELAKACLLFAGQSFDELVQLDEDLLTLDGDLFEKLISSREVDFSEDLRMKAILRWVNHDADGRQSIAPKLCGHIEVPRLSREYFVQLCRSEAQWGSTPWLGKFLMNALMRQLNLVEPETTAVEKSKIPEYNDFIVIAGGGVAKDVVEFFDLKTQTWASTSSSDESSKPSGTMTFPKLPCARHGCAAVVVDDVLYLIGGITDVVTSSVDVYNPASGFWVSGPTMQHPRRWLGATVLNQKIYAIGGFDGKTRLNSAEMLEYSSDKWRSIAPMLSRRSSLGVAALRGNIYAAGGFTSNDVRLSTVECYNPDSNTWTSIRGMASPRCGLGLCAIDNSLYAVGGWCANVGVSSATEVYSRDTNSWTTVSSMTIKRGGLGLVAHNGILYAIGGWDGGNRLTSIERYDPSSDKWTMLSGQMKIGRYNSGVAVLRLKSCD